MTNKTLKEETRSGSQPRGRENEKCENRLRNSQIYSKIMDFEGNQIGIV